MHPVCRKTSGPIRRRSGALLQTFADQAVIAIENVRLFNETKEALERQTATTEVLKVISESPTDVQPVFDIIAERAARLTGAQYGLVFRFDGELIHVVELVRRRSRGLSDLMRVFPMPADGPALAARAIRTGEVVNMADLLAESDADYPPVMKESVRKAGFRSGMSVPMLHDQRVIGAINVNRAEPGRFADKEVAPAADLRAPGRDRDRERAAVQRDQGGAGATDGHGRGAAGDQQLGGRRRPVFDKILESCEQLLPAQRRMRWALSTRTARLHCPWSG